MRFSSRKIEDNDKELPLDRNQDRLKFAKAIENKVRDVAPFPISYDVDAGQMTNFSEFTYTEYINGLYLKTQSTEINVRILEEILLEDDSIITEYTYCEELVKSVTDKYVLDAPNGKYKCKKLAIMTGHNAFDLISSEIIARAAFENDDFKVKLHPLTDDEYASKVAMYVGWNKVIPANIAVSSILEECDTVYASTATELCSVAVLKDKKIINASNFFNESSGCYYALNRLLFKADNPKEVLEKVLRSKKSGIILPFMDDYEERIEEYYKNALYIRSKYGNKASKSLFKHG